MHKVIIKVSYRQGKSKQKILAVQYEAKTKQLACDFIKFLQGETRETGALMVLAKSYARGVVSRARMPAP
jgi:hypothetical protein